MGHLVLSAVRMLLATQAAQATVTGSVLNEQTGAPVAGAAVVLTDLNRATMTDANGRYALRAVPAGPQHITVRAIGYAPRTLHALAPAAGELQINISLRALPVRLAVVNVRAPIAIRGAEGEGATFPERGITNAAIRNHPLLAEPDALQALAGGEVVIKPETPSGVHIRGGSSEHTGYVLDGIPVLSPYHAAGVFGAWNTDAIAGVGLAAMMPSPSHPDALSGAISAVTRTPGDRFNSQGAVSNTQARITVDGPLGLPNTTYLVSTRVGLGGMVAPKDEASYQRSETSDWIAKIETRVLGGNVRVLGYHNDNEIGTASSAIDAPPGAGPPPNNFEWKSQSVGAEWNRAFAHGGMRVLAWHAGADAFATWVPDSVPELLTSSRRDYGGVAEVNKTTAASTTTVGVRVERIRTSYRTADDTVGAVPFAAAVRTPVVALFAQHMHRLGERADLDLGTSLALHRGDARVAPRVRVAWLATPTLTLSGSYARTHQFAQSLRNAESVVGTVFPADIYMSAGAGGVPVARSDQGVIAADYRVSAGARFGAQLYARRFDGLALVAPRAGEPFASGDFVVGGGTSRGAALDLAISRSSWGFVASYGVQHTRREFADSAYVPDHGATHMIDAGVTAFPSPTLSLRIGASASFGRRTSIASGALEFESCNLADRGCEFRGSPDYSGSVLGGTPLPAYFRVDAGFRKHWHVDIGGRETQIGVFGTITNLLGRRNVLTYLRDPDTGRIATIRMRPFAPLVAGLDWRF